MEENKETQITKGTIVRTIMFAIVVINMILKAVGIEVISVDESQVYEFVEMIISALILILGFWKNNSFTKNARKADEYLKTLKSLEDEQQL